MLPGSRRRTEAPGNTNKEEEALDMVAGIYRVNSDGTIEALESVHV